MLIVWQKNFATNNIIIVFVMSRYRTMFLLESSDQITFKCLLHVVHCNSHLFTRFDIWFSSYYSCLCSTLNVSIKICSVVIGSLLYLSIWPRQTDKIPSAVLSHGNCGLLTTIPVSVLLHTACPFASWCLFWMNICTVWRWLPDFIQKQSEHVKYSGKCLWALELFYVSALNLIFSPSNLYFT